MQESILDVQLSVIAEDAITPDLEQQLRDALAVCFPADRNYFSRRSWWHSAPAYRVLAWRRREEIAAHTGVVRRTITVGTSARPVLVAGVQSVFVLPAYRRRGLVDRVLDRALQEARSRSFDCGLLFCKPELVKVYARCGWKELPPVPVTHSDKTGVKKPWRTANTIMFFPLALSDFPPGAVDLQGDDW